MGTEPRPNPRPIDETIGQKAVEVGLITAKQLADVVLDLTRIADTVPDLGAALVSRGLLSSAQLDVLSGAPLKRVGKYSIVRELGRGGMGVVYEAEDSELDRRVALKMLLGSMNSDPKESALEEERFVREARLSANLPKHPHIIGVYEAGILDGRRFIAMEFIEGLQFSDWRRQGSITLRQQVSVLRDAAMAVEHAHKHGIIHRDLKPANILIDTKNHPHVADFGLAKRTNQNATLSITASGMVMGTPAYMSPEQAHGDRSVDLRTDVWSLGIMLFEILTGKLPFDADSPVKILMKTVNDPVPAPSTMLKGRTAALDAAIEGICMRALSKDPKRRYPSARAFAEDLGRWLKGERVSIGLSPKRSLRIPVLAAGAAAAAVVLLAASWWLLSADHTREHLDEGDRLLKLGKYSDAYSEYREALKLDPGNEAAAAGKKKAEDRMQAAARPPAPPPAPLPVPSKPTEALKKELADLDAPLATLIDHENFGAARDLLTQASRRHSEEEWTRGVAALLETLRKKVDATYGPLKVDALISARNRDAIGVDAARKRVALWKWPGLEEELAAQLAKEKPAPAPPPPPAEIPVLRELAVIRGQTNAINSLAVSPDARFVVGSSWDKHVRVWDVVARAEKMKLVSNQAGTRSAWSPDGRWVAVGFSDGAIRVWDTDKYRERVIGGAGMQVLGLQFAPDSKTLVSAGVDGAARVWDVDSLAQRRSMTGHPGGAIGLTLSPDGRFLAVGSAEAVMRLWMLPEGEAVKSFEAPGRGSYFGMAYSPDGAQIAACGESGEMLIFDTATGAMRSLGKSAKVTMIAWSPDGRCIATASPPGGHLRLWDPRTGNSTTYSLEGGYFSIAFSKSGSLLAAGGFDWSLRLFEVK